MELILRIAEEGIYIRIPDTGGKRTGEEQQTLYNKTPKVTHVLCPYSWHCHGLAIDVVPLHRLGPLYFTALFHRDNLYERIARIAKSLNIRWGFEEWGMDKGHFHYSGGKTIYQLSKGKFPGKPTIQKHPYNKETDRAIERMKFRGIILENYFPYLYGNS